MIWQEKQRILNLNKREDILDESRNKKIEDIIFSDLKYEVRQAYRKAHVVIFNNDRQYPLKAVIMKNQWGHRSYLV